jgi:hypothetical protein
MAIADLVYLSLLAATLGTIAVLITSELLKWRERRRRGGAKSGSEAFGGGANPA